MKFWLRGSNASNCVAAVVRPDHYVYGVMEKVEDISPALAALKTG